MTVVTIDASPPTTEEVMERPARKHNWEWWEATGSRYVSYFCTQCHAGLKFGRKGQEDQGVISNPDSPSITGDCLKDCPGEEHCLGCYLQGRSEPCRPGCSYYGMAEHDGQETLPFEP